MISILQNFTCLLHIPSCALTPPFRAVILVLQNFAGLLHIPSCALTPLFRALILARQNFSGLIRMPSYALTPPFRAVIHETNRPGFSPYNESIETIKTYHLYVH